MEFREVFKFLLLEKDDGNQTKMSVQSGIPIPTINGWLTKNRLPRYEQIILLCKYFDVSADYLLGLEDISGKKTGTIGDSVISAEDYVLAKKISCLSPKEREVINKLTDDIVSLRG